MDEAEAFAGSATDWFDAVREAIERRQEHLPQADDSEPAYEAAAAAVQDARRKANRLHVVVPYGSELGKTADAVVSLLEGALAELDDWPPQEDEGGQEDEANQRVEDLALPEDERYEPVLAPIEDALAEAQMCHAMGVRAFASFVEEAAAEAHRAYFPIRRVAARMLTSLPRAVARRRRRRQLARERSAL
jgi:hypothetical protein